MILFMWLILILEVLGWLRVGWVVLVLGWGSVVVKFLGFVEV